MAHLLKLLSISFFLSISTMLLGQIDSVFISGKVYDYEQQEALKKAIFKINGELIQLSDNASFQCYVHQGDTLSFRYEGYQDYQVIIGKDLDQATYISGIFLNKQEIQASKHIIKPRLHNAKSFASYDPLEMQQMMNNARHNVSIAAYQAGKARDWDKSDNQKYQMTQKELDIEYKAAIKPSQTVGVGARTSVQYPTKDIELVAIGQEEIKQNLPINSEEEFYIITLFNAMIE